MNQSLLILLLRALNIFLYVDSDTGVLHTLCSVDYEYLKSRAHGLVFILLCLVLCLVYMVVEQSNAPLALSLEKGPGKNKVIKVSVTTWL
jgi:hypothetical protein